jgi:hypothetical protein
LLQNIKELVPNPKQIPITIESIYFTVLALFILKEVFVDREDEWQLLAKKAKNLLR